MKTTILLFIGILYIINVFAQSPQAFNYQAVVRNSSGLIIQNQLVGLQISILKNSSTGSISYKEEHSVTTNQFGLVNLVIGNGQNQIGSISSINWGIDSYFIKIEVDITGNTNYVAIGTSQLLSVPFAMYAASGNQGPAGVNGVGIVNTFIQNDSLYIYLTNGSTLNAGHVTGQQGPQGIQGLPGTNGQNGISVIWLGTFSSEPVNPTINQAFYNSTDKKSYIFDGTGWQIIAQDGMQGLQGIQGTQGDQGIQGLQGIQGVAGINGTDGVSVVWQGTLATAPDSPALNMAYYNSADKKSYIYNGTSWQIITQDGATGDQGIQGIQGLTGPAGTYTAGTGIQISSGIITNTSPNQIVTLTGSGATNVSGIYPDFTINSSDNNTTYYAGSGLSLTGTTFNSKWTTDGNNIYNNNTGFMGIGTSSPTSTLHVNGTLRITDDTEGSGKILTSDANGYASWQNPSGSIFTGTQNRIAKFTSANSLGNSLFYESGNYIGLGTTTPFGKLVVQGDSLSADSVPLFEVKDKSGNTVFVVWPTGAHFYIDSTSSAKAANRGSFAVSGKSQTKSFTNEFFSVNSDSIKASKSLYIPRMTTVERDALGFTPSEALIIFNTTDECMEIFKNGVWSNIWCFSCAPSIIQQSVNASICNNGDTGFSVSATGIDLIYQWQESSDGGNSWIDIVNGGSSPAYSNAATNVLSMSNIPAYLNAFKYRCVVSGSCNPAAISDAVTLNISTSDLTVITQPENVVLLAGCNTDFTVTTSAYGLYQWQQSINGGTIWNNISNGGASPVISGTSTVRLSLSNIPLSYNGYLFRCIVTNPCGTGTTSDNANLTVNANVLTATAATNLTNVSFSANWNVVPGATSYYLDVSTVVDFSSFVSGFNNLFVNSLTTYSVTGLSHNTTYYYRVRANNFCRNENSNTITVAPLPFSIGEVYGGGRVFYIDGTGQHGLIATPTDQSISAEWGCYLTAITGADGTTIGTGNQNTVDIEAGCTTSGIAADIAANLELNGYSDWFLPSKNELYQLYLNKFAVGGFSYDVYWSSSEYSADKAWRQNFNNGIQDNYVKTDPIGVRCVRVF